MAIKTKKKGEGKNLIKNGIEHFKEKVIHSRITEMKKEYI